jgi:membrane protein
LVSLFRKTTEEWIQDKCPQLGAALAYYTIFSLAPLALVLLAVFGLICGGSEQAREKITDQLRYFVDPSGVKVFQDIAANASEPKGGILAAALGIIIALLGASGVFGQLQDALNTIWGVKPKPGGGIWGFLRARFLSFAMVGGRVSENFVCRSQSEIKDGSDQEEGARRKGPGRQEAGD